MELLYILLVLLVLTRLAGEVAVRLGQPVMTGELVAGVILGLVVHHNQRFFPILGSLGENEVFIAVTDLAVFFLMLSAGIEMHPKDIAEGSITSVFTALGGMVLPLALGVGLGFAYLPESEFRAAQIAFLGTALAITAVPVAVKILMDLGKLDSPLGKAIVSAAILDDVFSLMLLAVLTALISTGELPGAEGLVLLVGQVLLFFVIVAFAGLILLPRLMRLVKRSWEEELEFSALLIVALGFSVLAELLNLHFILGAFFAGLYFGRRGISRKVYHDVQKKVNGITAGFLAPLFFASIGLHMDLSALTNIPVFLTLLIVFAIVGKLLGAGIPARLGGLSNADATMVGVGMSARGAVELVIADIAFRAGLFDHPDPPPPIIEYMFSAVVIMAVVTTLFTPIVMKLLLRNDTTEEVTAHE